MKSVQETHMQEARQKIALVIGASRGLGFAIAQALAPAYHIIAVGRTVGALEELDDAIQQKGGSATLAPLDITQEAAMAQLCRGIYDRWGQIDLWVHCAVFAAPLSPAKSIDFKDMEKSMAVNVTALARLIPYLTPILSQGADALFFADAQGQGHKFFGAYGASKAAQEALVQSWQREEKTLGLNVHLLTPAPMPTATRARFFPGEPRAPLTKCADEARRLLALVPALAHLDADAPGV